jgi:shikimate dehydrogenase
MNVSSQTKIVGLVGHPVEHSLSPQLHNKIYKQLGLDLIYLAFDVKENELSKALEGMKALGFLGFNVTIPYKELIIPFLDQLDPEAAAIGAVNTVKNEDGKLVGYNTDGIGFLHSLRTHGIDYYNKRILLLGAGGAARAIGIYLAMEGQEEIVILNRTQEKATALSQTINDYAGKTLSKAVSGIPSNIDIIINTTSLGMWPHTEGNPLKNFKLNPKTIVCDIVYNPRITSMLKQAKKHGCKTVKGIDMLVGQGLKSIEIWTGNNVDHLCSHNLL